MAGTLSEHDLVEIIRKQAEQLERSAAELRALNAETTRPTDATWNGSVVEAGQSATHPLKRWTELDPVAKAGFSQEDSGPSPPPPERHWC